MCVGCLCWKSHPTCTSDEGHHDQTQDEENSSVHASGFQTSTLHSTNTMALIPRFNYVTMSGLHLAKPQGTNTTPFPKISGGAGSGARADGIVVQIQREIREGSQLAHGRGQRGRSLRASQRCCGETCPFFRAPRRRGR